MKGKEINKQKKGSVAGIKKGEGGVVAKPLTMTKVSPSEKNYLGSQKQNIKRKINNDQPSNTKGTPRKVGRPRSQSTASDIGKGKHRNSTISGNNNSANTDYQNYNGRTAQEELVEKFRGNHLAPIYDKLFYGIYSGGQIKTDMIICSLYPS